jgi:hypothetical protein
MKQKVDEKNSVLPTNRAGKKRFLKSMTNKERGK